MAFTKEILLKSDPELKNRPYQIDALLSIFNHAKCLVKMFCGTGKSRIITNVIIREKRELSVVVFPSLALINQYSTDYLQNAEYAKHFKNHKKMNVSSENLKHENVESTTNELVIEKFLKLKSKKIVLVTYQSYHVLIKCLKEKKIGLVCYDEAHHIVSPETQKLVFMSPSPFEKEVFFTATPRNENGITMFDREDPENNMCGPVAYDYTYMQGLADKVLNQFEICVDMYTENTNASIYEAIARAILSKGTNRVLTFHSGVNGESSTDVRKFANEKLEEFQGAFYKVQKNEFPGKDGYYQKITFMSMDGETPTDVRKTYLLSLDETPDNEVYIISSCETIGEGVDTKKANMCVFADPKASIIKIIQNIGRVVRRNHEQPLSTILIPCFIDMNNYASAGGDRTKQDEIIREQMRSDKGDYAGILNVLSALRQEDPEIYDLCLNYPNRRAKEKSLKEQGFIIDEDDEDDEDDDEDERAIRYTPEQVHVMKEQDGKPLEIHTNDTIERFNVVSDDDEDEDEDEEEMLRLYYDEDEDVYKVIKPIDPSMKRDREIINPPPKKSGVKMSIHQNDELEILWGVKDELDFSKKFCTMVIESEVSFNVENWRSTLKKVCEYMDKEGKPPSQCDKNPDIEKLGNWVSNQKHNYKKNAHIMTNPDIRKEWEYTLEKYTEYLIIDEYARWRSMLKKSCDYMDTNNKRPSDSDKNSDVKKLAKWVGHQKENYKQKYGIMSNQDIRKEWENVLEKYRDYLNKDLEEQFRSNLKLVCSYIDTYNKSPSNSDKNPDIKKLATWICNQKKNYSKNASIMENPVIREEWEFLLKKYENYLFDSKEQWRSILKQVYDYMNAENKSPSQTDNNPKIKKLGAWVSTQKQNYSKNTHIMKNPDIRVEWEDALETYKEYLSDIVELWRLNLKNICVYMDVENKRPSSSDKNTEIRKLGQWICHQKKNYSKNTQIMKNPDIRLEWESVMDKYREYLSDYDEVWYSSLKEVCAYMDVENKRPSRSDKNPDIKKLASWINHQKQNFTKNDRCMKTPAIRKEWETTLEKYGKYLKQDIIPSTPQTTQIPPPEEIKPKRKSVKPNKPSKQPIISPPPPPKSYADLTEDERRKMCEKVLKSRQEEKGYRSTNPDDKDKINEIFAKSVSSINCDINSKIAFLDHVEFKTAFALLEMGIKPEQMLIPQRADNYTEMSKHELFGPYVVMGEFNDVLNQYMLGGGKVRGVYADYCSTLEKDGLPFLELIRTHRLNLIKGAVIGVTITLRNPEGVRYAGQDISVMEKKLLRMFPSSSNLFVEGGLLLEDDGPYTYGGGAPMATWLIQVE